MTNPKTDHKIRKPTSNPSPARPAARPAPAPERQTNSSATMIEACDRLGQKLDEFAGLFRAQMEAWRQSGPPAVPPAMRDNASHRGVETPATGRTSSVEETPPPTPAAQAGPARGQSQEQRRDPAANSPPSPTPQEGSEQDQRGKSRTNRGDDAGGWADAMLPSGGRAPAPPSGTPTDDGLVAMAQKARRLADTLSSSGQSWPEQAFSVQQALESIMAYLENQAATAAPKADMAGILDRLKNLEEEQQNLQSQFNNNR